MSINVLLIEDNSHKRSRVVEFLSSLTLPIVLTEAKSFTSGCNQFEVRDFDVILADISLPTYDKAEVESGGKFRPFAGREIARKIVRLGKSGIIIFLTQYKSFSDRGSAYSFEELKSMLSSECGDQFGGMIYYDSAQYAWKEALEAAIRGKNNRNANTDC